MAYNTQLLRIHLSAISLQFHFWKKILILLINVAYLVHFYLCLIEARDCQWKCIHLSYWILVGKDCSNNVLTVIRVIEWVPELEREKLCQLDHSHNQIACPSLLISTCSLQLSFFIIISSLPQFYVKTRDIPVNCNHSFYHLSTSRWYDIGIVSE